MPAFFTLENKYDLLGKLRRDVDRLERDATDSDAAFDCFVTAYHLVDWALPKKQRQQFEKANLIVQICRDLANGAKHFNNSAQRPSVTHADVHQGAFTDAFSDGFDISRLEVTLDGPAAKRFGAKATAIELARYALEFWTKQLEIGYRGVTRNPDSE